MTVLSVPTFLSAKIPVAEPVFRVTESPPTAATRSALSVFSVALAVPSYTLFEAVIPLTVISLTVMFAVVVG